MSLLLNDLIRQKETETIAYEQFLQNAEALVKKISSKESSEDYPSILKDNKEAIVLFNNLQDIQSSNLKEQNIKDQNLEEKQTRANLALKIDNIMREKAPADFRGDETRERLILNEIYRCNGSLSYVTIDF